jgi:hypothetical protein
VTPEERARQEIDKQLVQCGWVIQNRDEMNISAATGVAVREFPMLTGEADYLLYVAEHGDILIVSRGATIGRATIVRVRDLFCLMGSVILLKCIKLISSNYVAAYLKSRSAQRDLIALSGSTAQQAIYLRDIKAQLIALPPAAEQREIVLDTERRLSIVDEIEAQVEANLKRAARLRQGIPKRAFEGRIVPQKSSDERIEICARKPARQKAEASA